VDFEEGVVAIRLARKQCLDLALLDLRPERGEGGFGFGHDFGVVFFLAKLDEPRGVVQARVELGVGRERGVKVLALAKELLGALGVAPELRVLGDGVQVLETGLRLVPVKDASAKARGIA
jgi:hypothetical protein